MKTQLPALILTIFLCIISQVQCAVAADTVITPSSPRQDIVLSATLREKGETISEKDLTQLRTRLKAFAAILAQKLQAADESTRLLFAPILKRTENIQASPVAPALSADALSWEIRKVIAEIRENPITAMAYAESGVLTEFPPLTSIIPDKGPGATYRQNEKLRFVITANRDCHIRVFFISSGSDTGQGLFLQPLMFSPEPGRQSVRLAAGDSMILGEDGSFTVEPPYGNDLIIVVATEQEVKPRPSSAGHAVTFPLDFEKVFADVFALRSAEQLSLSSCFITSRPLEKETATRGILLSEDEAAALRLDENEWAAPPSMYRSIQAGPIIRIQNPDISNESNPIIEAASPFDLKISFEAKDAPVDMESLEVRAKKGFFTKSITSRVKEYIHGTVLEASGLDFPKGKFRILIEVADINGVLTSREYKLEVR